MNIALYFGSFNPIHKGHIAIAQYVVSQPQYDELWIVVSPHNPLKDAHTITEKSARLEMVKIAFKNNDYKQKITVSDFEFSLPKPSYTIDTLDKLKEKYPTYKFSIVMGEDSLAGLEKWKDWEGIINNYTLLVYPRKDEKAKTIMKHKNIVLMNDAPLYPISSTAVRECVKAGKYFESITTKEVAEYIKKHKLYGQ